MRINNKISINYTLKDSCPRVRRHDLYRKQYNWRETIACLFMIISTEASAYKGFRRQLLRTQVNSQPQW